MQSPSRPVTSNQDGLHPRLAEVVRRHLVHPDRTPLLPASVEAYRRLQSKRATCPGPLVLDAFSGTGESTLSLAQRHPRALVIGIDQSAHRLAKQATPEGDNYLLLQARCEDIWRLLARDGEGLAAHYLFYPNPWPKSTHLGRRVHGHPAFALLPRLGGTLELRSNWQLYVEEFGLALALAGHAGVVDRVPQGAAPISRFEAKYKSSGHTLWRFRVTLS